MKCEEKTTYKTFKTAKKNRSKAEAKVGHRLYVYKCDKCPYYHHSTLGNSADKFYFKDRNLKKTMLKKCRKCKIEKDIKDFYPDRLGKYGVGTTCRECKKSNIKPVKLKRTEVKRIGSKTKERLKTHGSENNLFIKKWLSEPRYCRNCLAEGKSLEESEVKRFHSSNFAHILAKGQYTDLDKYRYNINNIALVHGIYELKDDKGTTYNCHQELDTKLAGNKKQFDEVLALGDREKILDFIKKLK